MDSIDRFIVVSGVALACVACDKTEKGAPTTSTAPSASVAAANAPSGPTAAASATATATATAAVTVAETPSGTTAPSAAPAAVAPSATTAQKTTAATSATASARAQASAAPAAPLKPPVKFEQATAMYKLEAAPPASCNAGATCEVPLRLEALGPYHINKEYPYKLKTEPSQGVSFARPDGVFSKASGDFSQEGETVGVVKVRFTGESGQAKIRGVYKFSVCSASDCKLAEAQVAFETPIR